MNMRKWTGLVLALVLACVGSWTLLPAGTVTADENAGDGIQAKLHAMVDKLTPEQQAALYLLLSELTQQGGGDQKAAVDTDPLAIAKAKLSSFIEAAGKGDVEGMLANISDSFEHYQLGDKESLGDFLDSAVDMGYLDDLEVKLDEAKLEMDGDTAIIYPVEVSGAFGTGVFEFQAKQENGEWKIVGLDVSGI